MTAGDRQLIRAKREQAAQLRRLATELTAEAKAMEARLYDAPVLGGRALVDAAVAVLAQAPGHTMHYKELLAVVEAHSGMRVRGVDPAATLLANLDREARISSSGDRSGRYVLTPDLCLVV